MANFMTIEAEARERAGKGAARASRRAGKVPAVIYGAKQTPTLIQLEPRAVLKELNRGGWRSRLYQVSVDGSSSRALMRDIQFHPVTDVPIHVDFQRLAAGERIRVAVVVHFDNEANSVGLKRGGVLNVVRHSVEVLADPDTVPESFTADLAALDINDNVRWSDLRGTENVAPTITGRDFVIATVAPPTKAQELPGEADAPVAAAPGKAGAAKPATPSKGGAPAKAPAAKPAAKK